MFVCACVFVCVCVLKVCGQKMKRLSSWWRLRLLNDYNSMAMSFVMKLNFWQRKRYGIRLDSFLYLSRFTATIKTTVCSSSLFSKDLERQKHELDPVNAMFWKIAEFTFPFYSRTAYNGVVYNQ